MKSNSQKNTIINIITLGCAKNLVESERLASQLESNGIRILHNSNSPKARIVVINTCGFIEAAKKESIDTILSYIRSKEKGQIDQVHVIGCLSERYKSELKAEINEVDSYFGVNSIEEIVSGLGFQFRSQLLNERKLGTPSHYSYLKIAEGCNRKCSFCAIPMIHGNYHSRSIESLVSEAEILSSRKVKEIILIAQDLTYYGKDFVGKSKLAELIKQLSGIKDIEWIRLHYAYPHAFPKEVITQMKDLPKICKYVDIPFQHISDFMLKKMRRNINSNKTHELIELLRAEIPGIAIRTTLLVGHPGESEREFEELVNFVKWARFDRLGVFTYSHEEGTFAANNFKDNIPESVKIDRAERIMDIQAGISLELNQKKIGQQFKTIIDRREGDVYFGRTEFDSPEIDNELIIRNNKGIIKIGTFANVKITSATEYDLEGVFVN